MDSDEFILCLGYKSELIKRHFLEMREQVNDFTLHLSGDHHRCSMTESQDAGWDVTFAETGLQTGTGGRIRRVLKYIDTDVFALTYGDGIGDVDLTAQLRHHQRDGPAGDGDRGAPDQPVR